jgi:thiosulfate/3-mercaptopyruvate sulfurtransferase
LGDPFHQIIDVRSEAEYLGEKGTKGLKGNPLKLGHIPTAVNVNYKSAWTEKKTKEIKSYPELQALYKGLDPGRNVIVYCNSGRRSSFSYYILRLMGIDNVVTYEHSWKEWGVPQNFYPVETTPRKFSGDALPGTTKVAAGGTSQATSAEAGSGDAATTSTGGGPKGGYVSCGG